MLTPISHIVPPGGYHFMEGSTRIEGSSYINVAENLMRYRVDNKIDIGNPIGEVLTAVCTQYPHFCRDSQGTATGTDLPLASRVAQWVARLYGVLRGGDVTKLFVDQATADGRAQFCEKCPNNVSWAGGCGTCARDTRRISFTFRGGRNANTTKELLGCSILGHDNATAVWLKDQSLASPGEYEKLPFYCWRR